MTKTQVTQLSYQIVGAAIKVHKALGPGLLENVYEQCLKYELEKEGYDVVQQLTIPINYDGLTIKTSLKLDLLVDDLIVVELKTVESLLPVHTAQLITYMNLLKKPQGLLIDFYTDNITKSIRPLVNEFFKALPN